MNFVEFIVSYSVVIAELWFSLQKKRPKIIEQIEGIKWKLNLFLFLINFILILKILEILIKFSNLIRGIK